MDILISIAAEISKYAVKPIARHVGYLFLYKHNLEELKNQVEELKKLKELNELNTEAERRNGKEIGADVQDWLKSSDETLEKAKRLCEDSQCANIRCSRWCFPNLKSRHQLGRNAKKMTEKIAEVQRKGKFDGYRLFLPELPVEFISATRGSMKLESRSLKKEEILLALKDPKVSKIGVYGLSGVGKTTLVKDVVQQVKLDKLFNEVVLATISQVANYESIQDEIADQLGLQHFEMKTVVGKASQLCRRIKMEKAILIILDDIWEDIDLWKLGIPLEDNYDQLGIPSEDNYKGCKLLLTSRNLHILQKYEIQKKVILDVLNPEESWSLFQVMAGDAVNKDVELQNIARQVTQRCGGLPVLIVTVARSLRNQNSNYWKDALNSLKRVDNGEIGDSVFAALEFSYNRLGYNEAKEVFLICGVHGTSIFFSDLLKYVFGLGVFKDMNTIEDTRIRLYKVIDDLKASCLLLEDGANARLIQMHGLVCEVAKSIAYKDQITFSMNRDVGWQHWPNQDFLNRCSQIILDHCCIQKLPERLYCPNLKFLHINSSDNPTLKIPHSFFEGIGSLEVLDITGMIISSLPASLASLIKLKTLCLDQCSLKDMVGIGDLKNLEILSFIHSSMEKLPSEIGQLTHLRMLDLRASGIEIIPPNILSKLTNLEELYIGDASIKWEIENSTKQNRNASLVELRNLTSLTTLEIQTEASILLRDVMFEKLERYKVVIGDKWEWPDNDETLRLLKLKLDTNIRLEHGIKMLIKRVEDLYLDKVNGISNVLFQLNGEGFPLLKHLHIQNNGEIEHIVNSIGRNQIHVLFPKLETLTLLNLSKLEKICHGPFRVDSFKKLKSR